MSESKAMIMGAAGTSLTEREIAFFRDERPWGFILFARNLSDWAQIVELCAALRDCVGNENAPIFIDQEGGRVQRLRPPLAPDYPSGAAIGEIFQRDRDAGTRAAWLLSRLHAFDLVGLGITADCLPVLDIPVTGASNVIGDRAYGGDPDTVAALGRAAIDGLIAGGVLPVMKHIPGHGRAVVDSHLELPRVAADLDVLRQSDFEPFRRLNDCPMAMTAHVVFEAVDPREPATTSPAVIDRIIRGEIGFDGLLMSDDVSMRALSGDFGARTDAIFSAGCDVVLHCNGEFDEMRAVATRTPPLAGRSRARADAALARRASRTAMEELNARTEFADVLGTVA